MELWNPHFTAAAWERKILKRIYGCKVENGEWKIINNKDFMNCMGTYRLLVKLKVQD